MNGKHDLEADKHQPNPVGHRRWLDKLAEAAFLDTLSSPEGSPFIDLVCLFFFGRCIVQRQGTIRMRFVRCLFFFSPVVAAAAVAMSVRVGTQIRRCYSSCFRSTSSEALVPLLDAVAT